MIDVPEGTRYVVFNKAKINELWDKFQKHDAFFADSRTRDKAYFTEILSLRSTHALQMDGGIIWIEDVQVGHRCNAHFIVWDKRLDKNKTIIMKKSIIWAFLTFDLERMEILVAQYARPIMRFLEKRLGFTLEGRLRHRVKHEERFIDMFIYSILREEVLDGK